MHSPHSDPPSPLTRWLFVVAVLLLGGLVATWVGKGIYWIWQWHAFGQEYNALQTTVGAWRNTPPAGIDPHTWREAAGLSTIAVANVCFSPEHVSIEEMRRLRADVEAKRGEPITLETLDWFWQRLGQTGPHGAEYTTRMYPLWEEARTWVQNARDKAKE